MSDDQEFADLARKRFGADPGVSGADLDAAGAEGLRRLLDRRACRAYADRPIAEGLVQLVLAAGMSAPTKSDLQQADIIRVRDDAIRAKVIEGAPGADWIAAAPVFLVICGDGRRFASLFDAGAFANDHFDALFNAAVDGAIVLEGLIAAATLAGLGCCPISVIRNRADAVAEALALPDRVFPIAGLCIGWPAREGKFSPRMDLEATVHQDRYDADAFARVAPRYDARRAVEAPFARQRDPERFGEAELYGWTEEKRRQYADPQRADWGAFLRARGFRMD